MPQDEWGIIRPLTRPTQSKGQPARRSAYVNSHERGILQRCAGRARIGQLSGSGHRIIPSGLHHSPHSNMAHPKDTCRPVNEPIPRPPPPGLNNPHCWCHLRFSPSIGSRRSYRSPTDPSKSPRRLHSGQRRDLPPREATAGPDHLEGPDRGRKWAAKESEKTNSRPSWSGFVSILGTVGFG